MRHEVIDLGIESAPAFGETFDLLVHLADGLLRRLGLLALALAHERADVLGLGVARCLELLDLGDHGTALLIEREEAVAIPRGLAVRHRGIDRIGVLANELDVEHTSSGFLYLAVRRAERALHAHAGTSILPRRYRAYIVNGRVSNSG